MKVLHISDVIYHFTAKIVLSSLEEGEMRAPYNLWNPFVSPD
jgi:hypothetical protein